MDDLQQTPSVDLDRIVEESRSENSAGAAGNVTPIRGVGKPRKDGKPNRATLAKLAKMKEQMNGDSVSQQTPGPEAAAEPNYTSAPPPLPPGPFLPPVVLRPVVHMPFQIARHRTKYDGFSLDQQQEDQCIKALDDVLRRYMPKLESKHPELFALALTFGMIGTGQTLAYKAWKREQNAKTVKSEPVPQPTTAAQYADISGVDRSNPFFDAPTN